ncbi:PCI domain-containing protein [Heyndrickxia coagulans]|jgi:DNA-binding GntR family transcriptional regulator|uniref:Uncharacterized protein n=3 Tax=Heyndrickxia TaxID=2837504 RepID=A0A150K2R5_HEYCO|nr:hypothetical protein [Heyndrickxia coagulans]AEH54306.1 hypothetical protein BCO26_2248 [Heyndrickxia coagulans 2-6]AJH80220.1 hypothetical protein BF29_1376 [Heyndrickxia coagulans DSM 1 = ATCC 7050]KYC63787.1 hypothetical protein B4098_2175 [Heyndrickxia coagulans]MBF8417849.1 hypothetical protein [Heyndrickxia coagulans]MCR2846206.1 hypothetical protein [Heyndrickxia coagulans]
MEQAKLYERIKNMIISSTKEPKYTALSAVKLADLFDTDPREIEKAIRELVEQGKLKKSKLEGPPRADIYSLP